MVTERFQKNFSYIIIYYAPRKVWNYVRVCKLPQNFHFWVKYPFTYIIKKKKKKYTFN